MEMQTLRMSKAEALSFVAQLKKTFLIAAIAIFGVLSAVIASGLQSATASTPTSTTTGSSSAGASTQDEPFNSGNFFTRHRGGYQFGNDNSNGNDNGGPSFQSPNSGTRTS